MLARSCVRGLLLACLCSLVVGCGNPSGLDSIQVAAPTQSLTVGQTAQFSAIGTFGNAKHPTTRNLTSGVTWTSSTPTVATVSATGLVTAVAAGTTSITAGAVAFNGDVSSSANLTVTGSTGGTTGGSGGSILSLTIIPSGIVFGTLGDSGQFLAIGTFSNAPFVRDVTNSVTWLTSEPNKFPITNYGKGAPGGGTENGGVVSAYEASVGDVGATITAEATDSNGSIATATAGVGCPYVLPNPPNTPGSCFQDVPQLLTTLTVYNEGLNDTDWDVAAESATGTPNVIHCGPGDTSGASVCTATYPSVVFQPFQVPHVPIFPDDPTIIANLPPNTIVIRAKGGAFGGWSWTCTPSKPDGSQPKPGEPPITIHEGEPNYCTVTFGSGTDLTVGAIFN